MTTAHHPLRRRRARWLQAAGSTSDSCATGTDADRASDGGADTGGTHGGNVATASVDEQVVSEVDEELGVDRPWVVIVWNDPINLMSYVTFVFQKLFGYSLEKATELMLDVHEKGRASVFTGSREEAELHVFRLHEHSLWATMEQDT